jgi:hypothetical protein
MWWKFAAVRIHAETLRGIGAKKDIEGPPMFLRRKKAITVELEVVHQWHSLAASFLRVAANFHRHVCCSRHRDGSYILARYLST